MKELKLNEWFSVSTAGLPSHSVLEYRVTPLDGGMYRVERDHSMDDTEWFRQNEFIANSDELNELMGAFGYAPV